jgi:hypothetical protein
VIVGDEVLLDLWVNSAGAKMIVFIVLWTYGPYLSTVHLATARKQFFAARTTSAEISALAVRNCHPDQLVRDTVHTVQLDKVYSIRSCYSNIFDLLYLTHPLSLRRSSKATSIVRCLALVDSFGLIVPGYLLVLVVVQSS